MGLFKTVRRLTTLNSRLRRFQGPLEILIRGVRDERVPWAAKAVMVATLAYVASPIDIIPDFLPFIGHLDDMVLIPLGLAIAIAFLPLEIRPEYDSIRKGTPVPYHQPA
jgi:uncharacterized membrane protein YkvA (DUF1232 family)